MSDREVMFVVEFYIPGDTADWMPMDFYGIGFQSVFSRMGDPYEAFKTWYDGVFKCGYITYTYTEAIETVAKMKATGQVPHGPTLHINTQFRLKAVDLQTDRETHIYI